MLPGVQTVLRSLAGRFFARRLFSQFCSPTTSLQRRLQVPWPVCFDSREERLVPRHELWIYHPAWDSRIKTESQDDLDREVKDTGSSSNHYHPQIVRQRFTKLAHHMNPLDAHVARRKNVLILAVPLAFKGKDV